VSFPFDPTTGPIYVEAEVSGPTARSSLRLVLDTGATISLIDPSMLLAVGPVLIDRTRPRSRIIGLDPSARAGGERSRR
jgi:hypothetical protein